MSCPSSPSAAIPKPCASLSPPRTNSGPRPLSVTLPIQRCGAGAYFSTSLPEELPSPATSSGRPSPERRCKPNELREFAYCAAPLRLTALPSSFLTGALYDGAISQAVVLARSHILHFVQHSR